jgi:hypothetical protein
MRPRSLPIAISIVAILAVVGILLVRRSSWWQPKVQARRYLHQHLPQSEWEPMARLTTKSHTLRGGESLASVADLRDGHENYSSIIKLYNHIEDAAAVATGATLGVPDIATILADEGFTKVAASEMELILCSRAKHDRVKTELWDRRRDTPSGQRVVVPPKIEQELLEAADDLQQATESLKANKPGTGRPPAKMIRQLEDAMRLMRELADGSNDGYGYDIDMVQQRYGLGLTYAIIWAREGFQ